MPPVPDHSAELTLLWFALLNAAVFAAALRFASRRLTDSRSQAWLDAALLTVAVQYAAMAGPGTVGLLRLPVVVGVAIAATLALSVAAGRRRAIRRRRDPFVLAVAAFTTAVVLGYAWHQADLPVTNNDALTYHFPAAAQWLQRGRIDVFPTWFFNPANAYSPLAGSAWVAWLMVPFGSDVLARFVQVPAVLCVGLGVYRLGRQRSATPTAAALAAAAAVLCRPLFTAALMGKDDLFVAFTFVATLVALAPDRTRERFGPARVGLALGLLLATKYTALLAVPLLLPAVRRPHGIGRWTVAVTITVAIAGPWYARNWLATGNPLFPLDLSQVFHGRFTTARSDALGSPLQVIVGGGFGVPAAVAIVGGVGWLATVARPGRRRWRDPLLRAVAVGPPLGVALFVWRSPFPEVRFLFPAVLLLIVTAATAWPLAAAVLVASVATISVRGGWQLFGWLVPASAGLAVAIVAVDRLTDGRVWWRRLAVTGTVAAVAVLAYVRWTAYCRRSADPTLRSAAWAGSGYAAESALWTFVDAHAPADATVAYADLYLVYPLQGPALRRRLVYVPSRRGVRTTADLPWLGDHLSGERLVDAANAATVADPDLASWAEGVRRSGADYLVVGRRVGGPELAWASADPARFRPVYAGPAGHVFAVRR